MTADQLDLENIVVDRSPELMRRARTGITIRNIQREDDITPGDIAASVRGDGATCALAQVLRRTWPGAREINVSGERPYIITAEGQTVLLTLGSEVVEWIGRFDRGEDAEPFKVIISQTIYR